MGDAAVVDPLLEKARAHIGDAPSDPITARDPVNQAMVNHWCDAMGDANPVYRDEAAAVRTRHGGLIAPPQMLQSWCMDSMRIARSGSETGSGDQGVTATVMDLFTENGFPAVVASNYEQEYHRMLRHGDVLTQTQTIEDVSPLKRTALGEGYFVTMLSTYVDQSGAVVGTSRMRVLRYKPKPKTDSMARRPRPRPPIGPDTAFFWEGAERGELLVQKCTGCGALRHPPAPSCAACTDLGWEPVQLSGRGTVYSYVVHHHPPLPGFTLPAPIALVQLEEGLRLVCGIDVPPDQVEIGAPVRIEFPRLEEGLLLPLAVPPDRAPTAPPSAGDSGVSRETRGPVAEKTLDQNGGAGVTGLAVGTRLPELTLELSALLVVSGAFASRDFQDVHHDHARAVELGSKDVFMNILTSNGLVCRFVTDWTGPDTIIKKSSIRLGVPAYVGDSMTLRGEVISVTPQGDSNLVDIKVVGTDSLGDHVTGTVTVDVVEPER